MVMERFYIITNHLKDGNKEITTRIQTYVESQGKVCLFPDDEKEHWVIQKELEDQIDCVIVIGGDGTLIQASRKLVNVGAPILGVNLGTLGYLTEVEVQNIEDAIARLIANEYTIEKRMMLYGKIGTNKREIALNDIVVTRKGHLRIVELNVYVNGEFLNSYQADGVIISTPTGSTAYSLSAGGPIIEPTAAMILLTPICSHALNKSSIVFSAGDEITIEVGRNRGSSDGVAVSFDGLEGATLGVGEKIVIRRARETTKLIKLSNTSFLEVLREKMKGN